MLHPDTVLRAVNDAIGVGVFATRRIPRGTITWARDSLDLALPHVEVEAMNEHRRSVVRRYAWRHGDHWILCWDHGRFINHDCDANCLGLHPDFEIALRDIEAGEQLTDDYRSLGIFDDAFDCLCGSRMCTGHVAPADTPRLRAGWAARYTTAVADLGRVEQPLLSYVDPRALPSSAPTLAQARPQPRAATFP